MLYSNRSAAYASGKKYNEALDDAEDAIRLKPDFIKVSNATLAKNETEWDACIILYYIILCMAA